ncbi:formyltransferase family protein [Neobacillus sp. WH10]|uniref:formyltransferase family protein n=1 Tax=Neobacillus sp. WH10 TaxID=3047873 RepID=UPI0024C17F72|nr:formyltransferase family protein [Neobacillus sp. WH10]WHY76632.1 formyltransferase family protein [Neobacillus sp. WH10]
MRIGFVTVVKLGLSCIEEIYRIGGKLELLITLQDNLARHKSGRVYLDDFEMKHNIPLYKIKNINQPDVIDLIKEYKIDWLFIIGWSQIAKAELLSSPAKGCIGMHPTLLPRGRGRAAIPWAILMGLNETGVTLFKLEEGADTGPILGQVKVGISPTENATSLYKKIDEAHIALISRYWDAIVNDTLEPQIQDDSAATVWPGRKPEDGEILNSMTMDEADKLVRAVTHPYPGAFYKYKDKLIRIWSASTNKSEGEIRLSDGYMTPIDYEDFLIL